MKKVLSSALAIVFLFSFVLAGCGAKTAVLPTSTDKPSVEKTTAPAATKAPEAATAADKYKESPYFAGKGLPPVKDRLPKEPKITNEMPAELLDYEIGTYGGTLRSASNDLNYNPNVFVLNNEPLINTPGILGEEITGNIVKSYEASPDQKEYTFHMREGLKWSDGQSVTMEDVRFAIEDFLFNKELTPIFPSWLSSGGDANGTPLKFAIVDDFIFKLVFDKPYGGFAVRLAIQGWRGYQDILKPSAFLKKYHKKYADPAALEAAIATAKFKPGEWVNLFNDKDIINSEQGNAKAIGFPVLYPWVCSKQTESTTEFERNPYYFKVDAEGNQLPYIDRIVSTLAQDVEMITMKIISGEVDFAYGMFTSMPKIPLYKENQERGGYNIYMTKYHTTPTDIHFNLTHADPIWKKVVQDIRFRKALNFAINRKEILDAIYFGFGEPGKMIESTFDLNQANKLLDEMGMTKGTDGFRKGPDGKKFSIPFEVAPHVVDMAPVIEMVVEQWKELGLDVTMKTIDPALWGTRNAANQLKATVMFTATPLWYFGDWGQYLWGPLWNAYQTTGGKQGEKPPVDVQKFYDLMAKVSVLSPEEGRKAIDELKTELGKNIWYFVWAENIKQPFIANKKLGNISDKSFSIACAFAGEQFFFKKK